MEIDPSAPGPPPIWEIEDTAQTSYESIYGYDVDAQLHYNPLRIPSGFGRDIFHDPRYEEEPDSYAVATMKFNTLYRQVENHFEIMKNEHFLTQAAMLNEANHRICDFKHLHARVMDARSAETDADVAKAHELAIRFQFLVAACTSKAEEIYRSFGLSSLAPEDKRWQDHPAHLEAEAEEEREWIADWKIDEVQPESVIKDTMPSL
ncbi:uncharacterized protein GGS25DRAFT_524317 [Hypoxylon fragiforme]|uniref:uncharacterized protein n=1 Tax=Hypoxylon fragiforme TaxID=63214 RepID=UPI0020C5BE19|nr:uncharacterized protein GGS25DRAFT_524317 [Hypoxylon fragiforme]KAI2604823.1 hypothetical protein GGS25DRAFT_524317 [Hypoxylon fragiforme]